MKKEAKDGSMKELSHSIDKLAELLKEGTEDMSSDPEHPLIKKLDQLLTQNKDIAEAILLLLELHREHMPKISGSKTQTVANNLMAFTPRREELSIGQEPYQEEKFETSMPQHMQNSMQFDDTPRMPQRPQAPRSQPPRPSMPPRQSPRPRISSPNPPPYNQSNNEQFFPENRTLEDMYQEELTPNRDNFEGADPDSVLDSASSIAPANGSQDMPPLPPSNYPTQTRDDNVLPPLPDADNPPPPPQKRKGDDMPDFPVLKRRGNMDFDVP